MPDVTRPSLNHVALTVTNLERSVPWYENVFDVKQQIEAPFAGGVHKLLADPEWQLVIVLARHEANQGENFVEARTGLDHMGFMVASRAELEAWQARLEENGVVRAAASAAIASCKTLVRPRRAGARLLQSLASYTHW